MKDDMYNVDAILYAITYKESLEDRAATTGNYSLLSVVVDAEAIIKQAGFTARQQDIFNMYYIDDYTLVTIASKLGISYQGVADCLSQCKKKIQKVLDNMEEVTV